MSYVYLEHKRLPRRVGVYEAIPFDSVLSGDCMSSDGRTVQINRSGVYVAHWHVPARFYDETPDPDCAENILIALVQDGNIVGKSVTNIDAENGRDQEYSEIVSGVSMFTVDCNGSNLSLENHSQEDITIPAQSNSSYCQQTCAGGSFAIYRIADYDPSSNNCPDDDDDDDDESVCN